MPTCPACSKVAVESDARFCSRCGTRLPKPVEPSPDGTYWGIYNRYNEDWTDTVRGSHTAEETLQVINSRAYLSLYRGDRPHGDKVPTPELRLARVSDGQRSGEYYVHVVHEWYSLVWSDADGGQWVQGPEAKDRPTDNRIVLHPLERG